MPSQRPSRSHHVHFPEGKKVGQSPETSIYLAIAVIGGLICLTKPILLLFAGALVAYGKLHHDGKHPSKHGTGIIRFDNHQDVRHDSLEDLGNMLGLTDEKGKHGAKRLFKRDGELRTPLLDYSTPS
jgi:hypothetical protein